MASERRSDPGGEFEQLALIRARRELAFWTIRQVAQSILLMCLTLDLTVALLAGDLSIGRGLQVPQLGGWMLLMLRPDDRRSEAFEACADDRASRRRLQESHRSQKGPSQTP